MNGPVLLGQEVGLDRVVRQRERRRRLLIGDRRRGEGGRGLVDAIVLRRADARRGLGIRQAGDPRRGGRRGRTRRAQGRDRADRPRARGRAGRRLGAPGNGEGTCAGRSSRSGCRPGPSWQSASSWSDPPSCRVRGDSLRGRGGSGPRLPDDGSTSDLALGLRVRRALPRRHAGRTLAEVPESCPDRFGPTSGGPRPVVAQGLALEGPEPVEAGLGQVEQGRRAGSRENVPPSPVPWTSTRPPPPSRTTFRSTSAVESSA